MNDEKFIKLSLMEKMQPPPGIEGLDGDYYFTNLDDFYGDHHP